MFTSLKSFKESLNNKIQLHYEFKCNDADEDGIFSADDCLFGEIDSTEFAQFIEQMEEHEITRDQFEAKFNLPKGDTVIINANPQYLQFYDNSANNRIVVVYDGDIHFMYSI